MIQKKLCQLRYCSNTNDHNWKGNMTMENKMTAWEQYKQTRKENQEKECETAREMLEVCKKNNCTVANVENAIKLLQSLIKRTKV